MLTLTLALVAVIAALVVDAVGRRRTTASLERRLAVAAHDLEGLQRAFARFAPARVVEDIAQGREPVPARKDVTVLFADLRGFTPLAERLEPGVLVEVLNGWLRRMSAVLSVHQGHTAKFIGDGIMALFGALEPNPWQTNDAAHAALAMRTALTEYNSVLAIAGMPTLAMGIGIHRGAVTAGVLGSADLVEYGVVGSTVNVAARVERLTRTHGVDVLVTTDVAEALDRRFRLEPMPAATVKGLTIPLVTHALRGFDEA
ncbi:MAG TPA: adenylate/guanylate cyclase domain-containing protein, partial [Candidatus Binatia bacterium]|nr:adenylate/guanylate cyclase domain-containing protein [Candidatus Binatia bacterium]